VTKVGLFDPALCPNTIAGEIRCDAPHGRLFTFHGVLKLKKVTRTSNETEAAVATVPLTIEHVALRGMKLCNTEAVIGVIVGAGPESKLLLNMKPVGR
jgi:hypothetical protein